MAEEVPKEVAEAQALTPTERLHGLIETQSYGQALTLLVDLLAAEGAFVQSKARAKRGP